MNGGIYIYIHHAHLYICTCTYTCIRACAHACTHIPALVFPGRTPAKLSEYTQRDHTAASLEAGGGTLLPTSPELVDGTLLP